MADHGPPFRRQQLTAQEAEKEVRIRMALVCWAHTGILYNDDSFGASACNSWKDPGRTTLLAWRTKIHPSRHVTISPSRAHYSLRGDEQTESLMIRTLRSLVVS